MKTLYLLIIALVFFSCTQKEIQIANLSETKVGGFAAKELTQYLGKSFNAVKFSETISKETSDIQLLLSSQAEQMGIERFLQNGEFQNHSQRRQIINNWI